MIHNLKIFWQFIKMNLKQLLIYRANLLVTLWSMILWIGLYAIFFEVLFLHVDQVAGWEKGEMLLFLAMYYLVIGIGNIFYRDGVDEFGERQRRGELDKMITKPASLQLQAFFDKIRIDHLMDILLTAMLIAYISRFTDVQFTLLSSLAGLALAIFANILFYSFTLIISAITIYVDRLEGAGSLLWSASQFSRYPRQIFKGAVGFVVKFIFPIGLIVSLPTEMALQHIDLKLLGYFFVISLVFFSMASLFFKHALKSYSSAN